MFWMLSPGASGWTSLSLYGGNTFLWITGPGQPQGTYQFGVWARQPGSTAAYDAYQIITYQLVFPPCKAATIAPNVASPQANGTSVTFTAQCTSVGSGETFQFWEYPPGGTWTIKQAYSPTNTFTETVTVVGPHYFGVWIKGPFSTNSYDVYAIITFEAGP